MSWTPIRRWAVAVTVYLIAVFHRTSLGVVGLQASARFGISPSQLSVFALLQLGVYAGMQIPTGILVDRFGPRRLLVAAAATMAAAQALFAVAQTYPIALLARALLGCGDALTFVSVLRFAAGQFSPRRFPLVVAITSMLGSVGNLAATLPLSEVLHAAGWTPTFLGVAIISAVSGAMVFIVLPAGPRLQRRPRELHALLVATRAVRDRVSAAWSMAGTRAGFWLHFCCMSTGLAFGVLWGVPFMIDGQGLSRNQAGELLLTNVLFAVLAGPFIGYLVGRYRATRIPLAIVLCLVTVLGWALALACFPGAMPRPLLIVLVLVTGLGVPMSAIGFSLARDYNGPSIVGTATGVVNVGGFTAGIAACLGIGWTLDAVGAVDAHAYRLAFSVAIAVQAFGLVQMIRWWLRARHMVLQAQERGEQMPIPLVRHRWDRS